jgi:hypothetical protein
MKLNIVPARMGIQWVKLGIQTFFKQPLALSGLFFMFLAAMALVNVVPVLGIALALGLLPAATLGLMVATREAALGKFPMPAILLAAFKAGQEKRQAMLVLGGLYALGFVAAMGLSALVDGGNFAKLALVGGKVDREMVMQPSFQVAMWVALGLYLPLSLTFWHAPALVYWHGVPPLKSLFFSLVACLRNFWALTVFGLVWMGTFMLVGLVVALLASIPGDPELAAAMMFPTAVILAAMFITSIYFTFRDSFTTDEGADT